MHFYVGWGISVGRFEYFRLTWIEEKQGGKRNIKARKDRHLEKYAESQDNERKKWEIQIEGEGQKGGDRVEGKWENEREKIKGKKSKQMIKEKRGKGVCICVSPCRSSVVGQYFLPALVL